MKTRNWIIIGVLMAAAIYAAAEGVITTQNGSLILRPASKSVNLDDASLIVEDGRYIYANSPDNSKYAYMKHDGTNGVIATGTGSIVLSPANGNVGIGTTPSARLHLYTRSPAQYNSLIIENAQGDYQGMKYKASGGSGDYISHNILFEDARPNTGGSVGPFFTIYRSSTLTRGNILQVGNTTTASDLVVSSSGNVGIGTTNPAEKLEVNGKIKTTDKIKMRRPDGAYACCGPDNSNNWVCGGC